jgi:Putative addiction module component
LWESIDDNLLDVTEEEIQFAKKRLELHLQDPSAGISREELKKKYLRSVWVLKLSSNPLQKLI